MGPKGYGMSLLNKNIEETILEKLFKELNFQQHDDSSQCRKLFEKYDLDQDGYLTKRDIKRLMKDTYEKKDLKIEIDEDNVQHYFYLLDQDEDQKISFEEFESYFIRAINERNLKI